MEDGLEVDQEGDREISLEAVVLVQDHVRVLINVDNLSLSPIRETHSQLIF